MGDKGDPKKEAKRLLDRFKKELGDICENKDTTTVGPTMSLDEWCANQLLPDALKKEFVRLIGEEKENPFFMKLLTGNLTTFNKFAPQKKWFGGSCHGMTTIHRQFCNFPCFTIAIFKNGMLGSNYSFIKSMNPNTILSRPTFFLSEDIFNIEMNDSDETSIPGRFLPDGTATEIEMIKQYEIDTLTEYIPSKSYYWEERELELSDDGKILIEDQAVTIQVENEKIKDEKVIQWALNNDSAILLFESNFLAYGKIKNTKSGPVIYCNEVSGTSGTGSFAISSSFERIILQSAFIKKRAIASPMSTPIFEYFKSTIELLKKNMENHPYIFSHDSSEEYAKLYGTELDDERREILKMLCEDLCVALRAYKEGNLNLNYYLNGREDFTCRVQLQWLSAEYYDEVLDCSDSCNKCCFIEGLKTVGQEIIKQQEESEVLLDGGQLAFCQITTSMMHFLLLPGRKDQWVEYRNRIQPPSLGVRQYGEKHLIFPLDMYQLFFSQEGTPRSIESATRRVLQEYFQNTSNKEWATEVAMHRPDLLFFGLSPLLLPISFLKQFADVYQVKWKAVNEAKAAGLDDAAMSSALHKISSTYFTDLIAWTKKKPVKIADTSKKTTKPNKSNKSHKKSK